MVDIDERVVRMKFDSSDFETKTKSTFKILDTLKEKLSFKDVADTSEQNMQQIADNIDKMANKAYTIIDRIVDRIRENISNKLFNFLRDNTIGQVSSAWNKYADMTTAVATLKAQGYAMADITEQLERLNYFTDETSFEFTKMVGEIGKFTATGQKLEDATSAMMGIAEWAALSGKNAQEASRAMFQLSQALSAGAMRKEDWKSIQTLNMDTKEFRETALEAAVALGTLKQNADGTYTTLVGKKANKLTFAQKEFAETLTEGAWFTSDVMMQVYNTYSSAVDEVRAIYEQGSIEMLDGTERIVDTTAEALQAVKERNEEIISKFDRTKMSDKDINKVLNKWKKVRVVTDDVVDDYAEANNLSKEMAKTELNKQYAEYLKEYSEIFGESEENAEKAIDTWNKYVSSFGIKAFMSGQEAKTFLEAIDSAKDAVSTVWSNIFTKIFGNYDEAKALWTDLANALYEIFVERIADIKESIIDVWYDKGGRISLMQGIYGFASGFKQIFTAVDDEAWDIRRAWDSLFEDGESAQKLLDFSERLRVSGFKFYNFMKELSHTDFYTNIAESVMNVLKIFKTGFNILRSVVRAFIPEGETVISVLVRVTEIIKNFTAKLVPSEKTAKNIARILRGIISVFRFLGKVIVGLFNTILPVGDSILDVVTNIVGTILDVLANIGDIIFGIESTIDATGALSVVVEILQGAIKTLGKVFTKVFGKALNLIKPLLGGVIGLLKKLKNTISEIANGNGSGVLENMSNGFKDFCDRIKNAWNSVDSLKDTFNKFRGQTGLGAFLEMIGEMCVNVVKKIGNVVLAIFGLEEVAQNSKLKKGINNFKDILYNIFTVIKWIFTNVIIPIFRGILQGARASMEEIADAWKRGDVIFLLDYLKKIISTIGSMGIVKLIFSIQRLLGSGGFLRIIRNVAKTFKSLSRYLDALALEKHASAMLKFYIVLVGIIGVMFLLAQISDETYTKMWDAFGMVAAVMGLIVGSTMLVSVAAKWCAGGLMALAAAFFALALFVGLTVKTIREFGKTLSNLKDSELYQMFASGGLLSVISSGLIIFLAVMAFITKNAAGLAGVGATLIGLGLSLLAFAYAMDKTIHLMEEHSFEEIAQAFMIVAGGVATIALVMKLLTSSLIQVNAASEKVKMKNALASSLGLAIVTVASFITFALVMIPALDELAANMDKFEDYMKGLVLFIGMILSVSLALNMVNRNEGGGIKSLFTSLSFILFMNNLIYNVVPALNELSKINFNDAIGGVSAFGIFILTMAGAFMMVSKGIKMIFEGIASLKWKNIIALITGIFGVVLVLTYFSEQIDTGVIGAEGLLLALGTLMGVLIATGVFIGIINKSFNKGQKWAAQGTVAAIKAILGVIIAVGAIIILGAMGAGWMFNGDSEAIALTFASIAISLAGVLATIAIAYSLMVKSLSKNLTQENSDNIRGVIKSIMGLFISVGSVMAAILGEIIALSIIGLDNGEINSMIMTIGLTIAGILGTIAIAYSLMVKSLSKNMTKDNSGNIINIMNVMFKMLIAIFAAVAANLLIIGLAFGGGNQWMAAVDLAALTVLMGVTLGMMTKAFSTLIKTISETGVDDTSKFKKYIAFLVTFGIVAAGILIAIGMAFEKISGASANMPWGKTLFNALIMLGSFVVVVITITKSFESIFNTLRGSNIDGKKLTVIETVLGVMAIAMWEMGYLIEALNKAELGNSWDIVPFVLGVVAIIATITIAVIGLINTMKGITLEAQDVSVIIMTLGTILATIAIFGDKVLPAMKNLENVQAGKAIEACLGISAIIGTIGLIVMGINKISDDSKWKTSLVAIGGILAIFGELALLGDELTKFFAAFNNIEWDSINKVLLLLGGVELILGVFGVILGLFDQATKGAPVYGMAQVLASFLGMFWILQLVGKDAAEVIEMYNDIEWASIGKVLAVLTGFTLIVGILGTITGLFNQATYGLNALGMAEIILVILGIGWALGVVGSNITDFIMQFESIDWDTIWAAIGTLTLLAGITSVMGSVMAASIAGCAAFILVLIGLSFALELLAGAIVALRVAFGDESYLDYMERLGQLSLKTFTSKKGIDAHSPSKKFEQCGKWIDQGLALGIKKNMNTVKKASATLGIVTNESFQDELGIASPSKVFYENGRFIVRGLVNGANSQMGKLNNTGYDMGTNMANGLMEGIENSDNPFDLWFGEGEDSWISKFSKTMDSENGSLLGGLNDLLTGGETKIEDLDPETRRKYEEEKAALANAERAAKDAIVKDTNITGENKAKEIDKITKEYDKKRDELTKKYTKKSGGLGDIISGGVLSGFNDGFGGLLDKFDLNGILDGSGIGGGLIDWIKGFFTDDNTVGEASSSLSGFMGKIVGSKDVKTALKEGAEEVITNLTGEKNVMDAAYTFGEKFANGISEGLASVLEKIPVIGWLISAWKWVTGLIDKSDNADLVEVYNEVTHEVQWIHKSLVDTSEGNIIDIDGNLYYRYTPTKSTVEDWWKDQYKVTNEGYAKFLELRSKFNATEQDHINKESKRLMEDYGYTYSELNAMMEHYINDSNPYKKPNAIFNVPSKNKYSDQQIKDFEYEYATQIGNLKSTLMSTLNIGSTEAGEDVVYGFSHGFGQVWDREEKKWVFSIDKFIQDVRDHFQQHSPSKVFEKIGVNNVLGLDVGFQEQMPAFLRNVKTAMENTIDTVETQATNYKLPDLLADSHPAITPVLDDSVMRNSLSAAESSFSTLRPNVEATLNSFDRDIPDYSERFTSLENAMLNTNNLISGIIDMLENGSVVNVDVDVKPVPDNIYDSVIKTNYQRFRQSGHNGFLMR